MEALNFCLNVFVCWCLYIGLGHWVARWAINSLTDGEYIQLKGATLANPTLRRAIREDYNDDVDYYIEWCHTRLWPYYLLQLGYRAGRDAIFGRTDEVRW